MGPKLGTATATATGMKQHSVTTYSLLLNKELIRKNRSHYGEDGPQDLFCNATQTGIPGALIPKYCFSKYVTNTLVVAYQHVFGVKKYKLKLNLFVAHCGSVKKCSTTNYQQATQLKTYLWQIEGVSENFLHHGSN